MMAGHTEVLAKQKFHEINGGLQQYRIDTFIRTLEKQKGKNVGKILPFVRGLRFSALLIYYIRDLLSHNDLTACWGQIIDDNGEFLSRECDIIIHKKGYIGRWNGSGDGKPVMDFQFIDYNNAVAVISCKSYLTRTQVEIDYCSDLKAYVKDVWLFAECCSPSSVKKIESYAKKHGYNNFWHLYTYDKTSGDTIDNLTGWNEFVDKIRSLT